MHENMITAKLYGFCSIHLLQQCMVKMIFTINLQNDLTISLNWSKYDLVFTNYLLRILVFIKMHFFASVYMYYEKLSFCIILNESKEFASESPSPWKW